MLTTAETDTTQATQRRSVRNLIKDPSRRAEDRWYWVDDPTRTETGSERHERLLRDNRTIEMHGVAVVVERKYVTVKDMRHKADAWRAIADRMRRALAGDEVADRYFALERRIIDEAIYVTNPVYDEINRQLDEIDKTILDDAKKLLEAGPANANVEQVRQYLYEFEEVLDQLLIAIPRPRDVSGQSPQWAVSDLIDWRRKARMTNVWGDREENRGKLKKNTTARINRTS